MATDAQQTAEYLAKTHAGTPMPGYTHLQRAMPSSVDLWMGSFAEGFRDVAHLAKLTGEWIDSSPLGTAAGYGVPLPLDREGVAQELGFDRVQENPMQVQAARGRYEFQVLSVGWQALQEVRRLAWDLVLFSTQEFAFVTLGPGHRTGSSIMPNKHNPDMAELLRGQHAIVGGAMAPVSVAGTLTQVLAEVLAGIAYSQLIRPGAPVIFGAFVTSIDMNSGAPTFGTPEAAQITYGAGQLARRLNLPFRSAGSFNGSKLPDAQAAYETANTLNVGLLSGVNFMLHACGWLEGGLVASFEKFVMDADQLGALHKMAQGISVDTEAQAMDALREVGPGGHYLGCAHTQAHFQSAFWKSDLLDYKPYETWSEEGARDTVMLAAARVEKLLADYQQPGMDPAIAEALAAYVAERKASEPDAFT